METPELCRQYGIYETTCGPAVDTVQGQLFQQAWLLQVR